MSSDSLGALGAGEALDRPLFDPSVRAVGRFYAALMEQDPGRLRACLHDAVSYSSPVFPDLRRELVMGGWELMLEDMEDIRLEHDVLFADERKAQVAWTCRYRHGSRSVKFEGLSTFSLWDDKIVRQVDEWRFGPWARRHFGLKSWLFAWSGSFRKHCQQIAMDRLHNRSTGYR